MIRLKKHIAILLFGIFFFPITFHASHVIWHHLHDQCGKHYLCYPEASHKHPKSNTESISQNENFCPICAYQFSINDLPETPIFRSTIPVFVCIYSNIAAQKQYKQAFADKSPRAPPILIS